MDLRNTIFGFLNSLKAYTGIVGGLHDPVKIAKRKDHERKFQAAIDADPALRAEYGDLIPRMAELQAQKREHAAALSSFLALGHPELGSSTLARAFAAFQYLSAQSQGAPAEVVDRDAGGHCQAPRSSHGRSMRPNSPNASTTSSGTSGPTTPSSRRSSREGPRRVWRP